MNLISGDLFVVMSCIIFCLDAVHAKDVVTTKEQDSAIKNNTNDINKSIEANSTISKDLQEKAFKKIEDFMKEFNLSSQKGKMIEKLTGIATELQSPLFKDETSLVKSGKKLPEAFWRINSQKGDYELKTSAPEFMKISVDKYPEQLLLYVVSYNLAKTNIPLACDLLRKRANMLPPTVGDALIYQGVVMGIQENENLRFTGENATPKLSIDTHVIKELIHAPNPIYRLLFLNVMLEKSARDEKELVEYYKEYINETDPSIQSEIAFQLEDKESKEAKDLMKTLHLKWKIRNASSK